MEIIAQIEKDTQSSPSCHTTVRELCGFLLISCTLFGLAEATAVEGVCVLHSQLEIHLEMHTALKIYWTEKQEPPRFLSLLAQAASRAGW